MAWSSWVNDPKYSVRAGQGYGAPYVVFASPARRVQLTVSDLRGIGRSLTFTVYELPASAKRSTPFVQGKLVYHGESAADALEAAGLAWGMEIDPAQEIPPRLRTYFDSRQTTRRRARERR